MSSDYIPTPEEIREGCLAIQAGWDDETRLSRQVRKPTRYEIPGLERNESVVGRSELSEFIHKGGDYGHSWKQFLAEHGR